MTVPEVRPLLVHLLEVRAWDVAEILGGWPGVRRGIAERQSAIVSCDSPSKSTASEVDPGNLRCNPSLRCEK
jgi:hypothetical protein